MRKCYWVKKMFNASKLKEIRLSKNLTQSEVANMLQVTRSSYAMWESNNNIIPLKRLIDFCDLFKVSLNYVFEFSSNNSYERPGYDLKLCSERLKEFRKDFNLTQQKISAILHIDQPTWSIYERGKSLIGTPFLYDLCHKYHISADYLLGKTNEPKCLK